MPPEIDKVDIKDLDLPTFEDLEIVIEIVEDEDGEDVFVPLETIDVE